MTEDKTPAPPLGLDSTAGLGLAPERDAVLAQLDDTTNQTWRGKRARWAALVRAQDAEIQRLVAAHDAAVQALRDEMDENLRLRELGGARPDENITAMTERVIRERDELRRAAMLGDVSAERERCAKVCEAVASDLESAEEDAQAMSIGAQSCADQIRAGA